MTPIHHWTWGQHVNTAYTRFINEIRDNEPEDVSHPLSSQFHLLPLSILNIIFIDTILHLASPPSCFIISLFSTFQHHSGWIHLYPSGKDRQASDSGPGMCYRLRTQWGKKQNLFRNLEGEIRVNRYGQREVSNILIIRYVNDSIEIVTDLLMKHREGRPSHWKTTHLLRPSSNAP